MLRIETDLLIPGLGAPSRATAVDVEGSTIAAVRPIVEAPELAAGGEHMRVPVLMPGLWDCHGHFMGVTAAQNPLRLAEPVTMAAARAAIDVEVALQAGFTSIREVGGHGCELARVVDEGILRGPTIYAAGSILSTTGGHDDHHELPLGWMHDYCNLPTSFFHLCDGIPECLKAVRTQLRRGARLIKVCASGGVMSVRDDPIHQQFSGAELRAIVEEAGLADRIVAAHCHGKPGILAALEAGCRTIEHGSYLDDETAAAMRETGAILVPTRIIVDRLQNVTTGLHPESIRKLHEIADRHREAVQLAIATGVRIAAGTDISTSARQRGGMPWGINGRELACLVDLGMSPLAAIEAATGPETLGPQGPQAGIVAEGYDADLIALTADPVEDISLLGRPECVTHVWRHGVLVKSAPTVAGRGVPSP